MFPLEHDHFHRQLTCLYLEANSVPNNDIPIYAVNVFDDSA